MILLDTHVVAWLALEPEQLSQKAEEIIVSARAEPAGVAISDVTLWELAMMSKKRRIVFDVPLEEFLHEVERTFVVLPVNGQVARVAFELTDRYPADPMDRIIGATALVHGMELLTRDVKIRASGEVRCIW